MRVLFAAGCLCVYRCFPLCVCLYLPGCVLTLPDCVSSCSCFMWSLYSLAVLQCLMLAVLPCQPQQPSARQNTSHIHYTFHETLANVITATCTESFIDISSRKNSKIIIFIYSFYKSFHFPYILITLYKYSRYRLSSSSLN